MRDPRQPSLHGPQGTRGVSCDNYQSVVAASGSTAQPERMPGMPWTGGPRATLPKQPQPSFPGASGYMGQPPT